MKWRVVWKSWLSDWFQTAPEWRRLELHFRGKHHTVKSIYSTERLTRKGQLYDVMCNSRLGLGTHWLSSTFKEVLTSRHYGIAWWIMWYSKCLKTWIVSVKKSVNTQIKENCLICTVLSGGPGALCGLPLAFSTSCLQINWKWKTHLQTLYAQPQSSSAGRAGPVTSLRLQ